MSFRRVIWIVLDSVGIGEMPDAAQYGDAGSDTLGHIAQSRKLHLNNLCRLGLGNIRPLDRLPPDPAPEGAYGRCALASPGKDTTTGHWEMAGIHLEKPFPVYPNGFPPEIMDEFERRIGRATLGNKAASGTEILEELGEEHMRTGSPIVYTSADSVFQIAAHEEAFGLDRLYELCRIARELVDEYRIGRVIARPFIGTPGTLRRTGHRRDLAVPPPAPTLLERLDAEGRAVVSIGKIGDIFAHRGTGTEIKADGNAAVFDATIKVAQSLAEGSLVLANFVDFDTLYGHRRDVAGYAGALEAFDERLPDFAAVLRPGDIAVVTADHGCDPTWPGSGHTREHVPVLAFGPAVRPAALGRRESFADIGQSLARHLGMAPLAYGTAWF
jgi:phosphopentomutase